jgi:hypothetical protein
MDDNLCFCGSGRALLRCHKMPRRARRARRIELEVLGEAHDVAFLFPFMRPKDALIDEFAWRLVAEMGSDTRDLSGAEAAAGVALLPHDERGRIIRMFSGRYPATWTSLCKKAGDVAALETAFAASAVRAAVIDRFPPDPELLERLEEEEFNSPLTAVALVLEPDQVWLYEEAAFVAFPAPTRAHLSRTRAQARRLAGWLPLEEFPRSSTMLREGCDLVRDDDGAARVASLLLEKYTMLVRSKEARSASIN